MDKFLTFTVVGLSTAAIYAVIASGLVLTYTTTGVFNFAHGAIGMLAAFTYWQLHVSWHWSTPAALFVVLFVLAPLFGVFLEAVVMRGLQGTGEVTKIVVSIGLLAAMIGLANWIWSPAENHTLSPFYAGKDPINVFSTTVTYHQAITMVVAILVAIALRFMLYRTRIGIAMRASVDDHSLARLNGARPGARGDARLGDRLRPRRDRRRPDRAGRRPGRGAALAADRQRLRGGDHRPAAEPAADVPGRGDPRAHRRVPDGVPAATASTSRASAWRARRSCCSSCSC